MQRTREIWGVWEGVGGCWQEMKGRVRAWCLLWAEMLCCGAWVVLTLPRCPSSCWGGDREQQAGRGKQVAVPFCIAEGRGRAAPGTGESSSALWRCSLVLFSSSHGRSPGWGCWQLRQLTPVPLFPACFQLALTPWPPSRMTGRVTGRAATCLCPARIPQSKTSSHPLFPPAQGLLWHHVAVESESSLICWDSPCRGVCCP